MIQALLSYSCLRLDSEPCTVLGVLEPVLIASSNCQYAGGLVTGNKISWGVDNGSPRSRQCSSVFNVVRTSTSNEEGSPLQKSTKSGPAAAAKKRQRRRSKFERTEHERGSTVVTSCCSYCIYFVRYRFLKKDNTSLCCYHLQFNPKPKVLTKAHLDSKQALEQEDGF